jgi:Mrp family chromosome partitioning ATPase
LDSDRFRTYIREVREEYDYVLIDNAPIGLVIDAAVVARVVDGAVLVVAIGKVSAREARKCKAQIEKSGCTLLGTVLNHTERKRHYYYSKRHGEYYYHHYEKK